MMNTRFLHCGKSLENYYICMKQQIAGFPRKGAQRGDVIYLAVIVNGINYCGARFVLGEPTDDYPWPVTETAYHNFRISRLEYCKPFALEKLAEFNDYWRLIFFQSSKNIKDAAALKFLEDSFQKNKIQEMFQF